MENLDKFNVIKGATVYNSTPGVTRNRAVERLNTLIAQLKSAGIMSEN